MRTMRVIFLDIDGVLNTKENCSVKHGPFYGIEDNLLANFKILYNKSNIEEETRVVISSSWRKSLLDWNYNDYGLYNYLVEKLLKENIPILDVTPQDRSYHSQKGREIFRWLVLHEGIYNITNYLILDDEECDYRNYGDWNEHFLKIDGDVGFTEDCIDKALGIFHGQRY